VTSLKALAGRLSHRTHLGCGLADNRRARGRCQSGRCAHKGETNRHKHSDQDRSHRFPPSLSPAQGSLARTCASSIPKFAYYGISNCAPSGFPNVICPIPLPPPAFLGRTAGGPEHLRWFWSFAVQGPMTRSNRVATFEEAKAQFQKAGKHGKLGRRWKRWMTRLEQRRRCVRVHGRHGRRRPGCSGVGLVLNGPELRYHLSEWRRSK
jgi:hypothetical protein